ncbi:DUF998 domain-containing protein [Cellulomonas shaoxiangyii]|nr:DUF998 domain-containing protein [Cellulomonas shaoxiangyii]
MRWCRPRRPRGRSGAGGRAAGRARRLLGGGRAAGARRETVLSGTVRGGAGRCCVGRRGRWRRARGPGRRRVARRCTHRARPARSTPAAPRPRVRAGGLPDHRSVAQHGRVTDDARPRRRDVRRHLVGGLLLLATVQVLVVEAVVASAWDVVPYSRADHYVSDLGLAECAELTGRTVCSPLHALMNTGFVVHAVLVVAAAVLLRDLVPGRARPWVVAAVLVHAVGVAWVGLVPGSLAEPVGGLPRYVVHNVGSVMAVVGGNVGALVAGAALLRRHRAWAVTSLLLGGIGAVATVLDVVGVDPGLGVGGSQRATMYPIVVWLVLTGAAVVVSASRDRRGGVPARGGGAGRHGA